MAVCTDWHESTWSRSGGTDRVTGQCFLHGVRCEPEVASSESQPVPSAFLATACDGATAVSPASEHGST